MIKVKWPHPARLVSRCAIYQSPNYERLMGVCSPEQKSRATDAAVRGWRPGRSNHRAPAAAQPALPAPLLWTRSAAISHAHLHDNNLISGPSVTWPAPAAPSMNTVNQACFCRRFCHRAAFACFARPRRDGRRDRCRGFGSLVTSPFFVPRRRYDVSLGTDIWYAVHALLPPI